MLRRLLLAMIPCLVSAQPEGIAHSKQLPRDENLNTDPDSRLWASAPRVTTEVSAKGTPTPGHRTEIRSRWTRDHLYFLFICPYEELYLTENPSTATETNKLWERDVAEIFIGGDRERIWQYREYQVSPQGEWVDLDIDRKQPLPEGGWKWNSGFSVQARIDASRKVWYGAFKIPTASINGARAEAGARLRANFFRIQGPPPNRKFIAWRPTNETGNHHVPSAFGWLVLDK